jgi:hypothetical protein
MVAELLGQEFTETISRRLLGYSAWMAFSTEPLLHDSERSIADIHRLFQLILTVLFRCVQRSPLLLLFL